MKITRQHLRQLILKEIHTMDGPPIMRYVGPDPRDALTTSELHHLMSQGVSPQKLANVDRRTPWVIQALGLDEPTVETPIQGDPDDDSDDAAELRDMADDLDANLYEFLMLNEGSPWGPSPTPEDFASGEWLRMPTATSSDRGGFNLDLDKIKNVEVEGIDMSDYPDFVDAFIASAEYEHSPGEFRDLTEDEIDHLNDNEDAWKYKQVWEQVN
jgi:hypothetical protein